MAEDHSLRDFTLGYALLSGAVVEPPAYGVYEVLFPDEAAAWLGLEPYQLLAFSPDARLPGGEPVTHLHYGHPLIERLVEALRDRTADMRGAINPIRLEKPGLAALAAKTFQFPNAHLTPVRGGERRRLHHYVCFNFKVSLIADEKREQLLPLWMDLQRGCPVDGSRVQSAAPIEAESAFPTLEAAAPQWDALAPRDPLAPEVLSALLERAVAVVPRALAETLDPFRRRLERFLELDRARLTDYYAGLQRDLERRLEKAGFDRRPGLESKLATLAIERESKLADAEEKYRLRIELELINLAVIGQPKLELDVEIARRSNVTRRTVAWDPLLHVLEDLVCDFCGQPGEEGLWLCETGHLAHAGCLSPQCIDCKRTFCRLCADRVGACAVCDRPVCAHSAVACKDCGRSTCREHAGLCHADAGRPLRVEAGDPHGVEEAVVEVKADPAPEPAAAPKPPPSGRARAPEKPAAKRDRQLDQIPARSIQVEIDVNRPVVTAFVMHKEKQLAARWWELGPDGIRVGCQCELAWRCPTNGLVLRPLGKASIRGQLAQELNRLAKEYRVVHVRIKYFNLAANAIYPAHRFEVGGLWQDPGALADSQAGYDRLSSKRR